MRLLAEKGLTFEKALELAQAMESAERDTQHLQSTQAATTRGTLQCCTSKDPQAAVCYPGRPADAVHVTGVEVSTHQQSANLKKQCVMPARKGGI